MKNRIIEIATDGVHLSLFRGFLKVSANGDETGRVALPDIGAVIVRGYGASLSLNLADKLAELNIPLVLCGANQSPSSIVWPIAGHHSQGHIIEAQASLTRPKKKRLWQSIVKAKITAQADALSISGEQFEDVRSMVARVKSGDPDNLEAQAARRYWQRMMGGEEPGFVRNRQSDGINVALNYGYTILRAGAARAIMAAGLHPSLSIHHDSRGEALRLVDDIMEPFRPWVDLTVRRLASDSGESFALERAEKAALVDVLSLDLEGPNGASPVQVCLHRLCQSLAGVCTKEWRDPEFPGPPVFKSATGGGKR